MIESYERDVTNMVSSSIHHIYSSFELKHQVLRHTDELIAMAMGLILAIWG